MRNLRALPQLVRRLVDVDGVVLSSEMRPDAKFDAAPFTCRMPLVSGKWDFGTILVTRTQLPFTSEERELLALIAEQVSTALALPKSRERLARAELVLAINNTIAANLELGALSRSIAQVLWQTLGCDFVIVSIPDFEAGEMIALAVDFRGALRGALSEGPRTPLEGSIVGEVVRSGRRSVLNEASDLDPTLVPGLKRKESRRPVSVH